MKPDLDDFEVYRSGPTFTLRCKHCGATWTFTRTNLSIVVDAAGEHHAEVAKRLRAEVR